MSLGQRSARSTNVQEGVIKNATGASLELEPELGHKPELDFISCRIDMAPDEAVKRF